MSVRPWAAGAASFASVVALFLLSPRWSGTVYAALLALLLLVAMRDGNAGLGKRLLVWTVPFLLPLLLVHGVLNTQFPISFWLLDIVPIRETGLAFGYDLALRVFTFSVVAAYWLSVDRDRMVEALISLRLPTALIMIAMQGFVMSRLVKDRIDAIYLAQRARGIPLSASYRQRRCQSDAKRSLSVKRSLTHETPQAMRFCHSARAAERRSL